MNTHQATKSALLTKAELEAVLAKTRQRIAGHSDRSAFSLAELKLAEKGLQESLDIGFYRQG